MKKVIFIMLAALVGLPAFAQETPDQIAKKYIREGDYNNAIVVLNRALAGDKGNREMKKDLAFAYYLQRDYAKALATARPLVEDREADVQSFQILGMIYRALEDRKEAEKLYRTGIKKFPEAGVLYSEYGEMLWARKEFAAASEQWQKGIRIDPNAAGNYYNAAKYYFMSADKISGLLYGEIFVNLESYSRRTPEIKTLLLEGYKKLFSDADLLKNQSAKSPFIQAIFEVMAHQSDAVAKGVTPETLSALRTRFILEWYERYAGRFPYKLFDYQRQLAGAGTFDAYNQWIFGVAEDLSGFQQWTATHSEEYGQFTKFQKNRVFKLPEGQYYIR